MQATGERVPRMPSASKRGRRVTSEKKPDLMSLAFMKSMITFRRHEAPSSPVGQGEKWVVVLGDLRSHGNSSSCHVCYIGHVYMLSISCVSDGHSGPLTLPQSLARAAVVCPFYRWEQGGSGGSQAWAF